MLLHLRAPRLGGINDCFESELATLAFKNREQIEDFHSRIIILQQEIILSGETVSPTIFLFQYMKALSKSYRLKSFISHQV